MPTITITDLLRQAAGHDSGLVRVIHGSLKLEELRYPTIYKRASQVAHVLRNRYQVAKGDVVVLVMPTEPAFYDIFFGVMLAGAIPCAVYPPVRFGFLPEWQAQTKAMINLIAARYVVSDQRLLGLLRSTTAVPVLTTSGLGAERMQETETAPDVAFDRDDVAVIQFSSGTTGAPKPIPISHRNITFNLEAIAERFPAKRPLVGVSWLPLYHDLGLFGVLMVGLACPGELTLLAPELFLARPRLWLELISERQAAISPAPNFAFGLCARKVKDVEGLDLSSWHMAICAAETIQEKTMLSFCTKFAPAGFQARAITPGYGLAETTLAVTMGCHDEQPRWLRCDETALTELGVINVETSRQCAGSEENLRRTLSLVGLGKPLSGVTIAIRDQVSDADLGENKLGRVMVKSPGIPEAITSGWLDTGDLGFLCDGELFLYGRAKDSIIIRGRNFDPALFEGRLLELEGIRPGCAVCFSTLDVEQDSEGLVVVAERAEPKPGEDQHLAEAIKVLLVQQFQLKPMAVTIVAAGTLPRTSSGKLSRSRARQLWLGSGLSEPRAFGAVRFLAKSLIGHLGVTTS